MSCVEFKPHEFFCNVQLTEMTKGVREWLVGVGIFQKNFCNTYINIWTFPPALPGGPRAKLLHRRKSVAPQHCALQQRAASRRPGAGGTSTRAMWPVTVRSFGSRLGWCPSLSVIWVAAGSLTEVTESMGSGRPEPVGFGSFRSFGHRFLVAGPRRGNARLSHHTAIVSILLQYINSSIKINR